jgi:hypothetical protein
VVVPYRSSSNDATTRETREQTRETREQTRETHEQTREIREQRGCCLCSPHDEWGSKDAETARGCLQNSPHDPGEQHQV